MSTSADHLLYHVLAPIAINTLDYIVPTVRLFIIVLHKSFQADQPETEPMIDVLIVSDSLPEPHSHRKQKTVVKGKDMGGLLSKLSGSIWKLALATYDTMSSLTE